jgi:Xaa-Pro aminopeptidase
MLYFGEVEVHDPFLAFGHGRRRLTVQSPLEFGRVRRTSRFDSVLRLDDWREKARRKFGPGAGMPEIIVTVARAHGLRAFRVADDFPAGLYLRLSRLGLRLHLANGALFPEREIKTDAELKQIREGNRLATVGFGVVEKILAAARIKGRALVHQGKVVTSESLRFQVETAIREQGGDAKDTIVAGGDQACDPHERGNGPIRPHQLVIVDIFPRVLKSGYFGDMTRTYLKGRASEPQRRLCATVLDAQRAAIRLIREGIDGRDVHELVIHVFTEAGYATTHSAKGSQGFIHGTGHGLGLAIHEVPRLSTVKYPLKKGSVVTVEPGLYYPGLGGCRWEDVVQVTSMAPRLLSRHPYDWEIR